MGFCNPKPTVVTGATYPEFQANRAALFATYDGNWTQVSQLTFQNGMYQQCFKQQFVVPRTGFLVYESKRSYFCGQLKYQRQSRRCGC